jgi:hypothetical protein
LLTHCRTPFEKSILIICLGWKSESGTVLEFKMLLWRIALRCGRWSVVDRHGGETSGIGECTQDQGAEAL